jgi:hypothetical protein
LSNLNGNPLAIVALSTLNVWEKIQQTEQAGHNGSIWESSCHPAGDGQEQRQGNLKHEHN